MEYKYKRRLLAGVSLFVLLLFYLAGSLSNSARVFGFIFGLFVFYFVDHMFNLEFKMRHYYIVFAILVFGILLAPLYSIYPRYDKILHFIMPVLGCFLIYHIVDRKELTIQWKLLITFMFIISFLAIHEMGEYLMDRLWDMKLQGVFIRDITGTEKFNLIVDRIDDTMIDMILGFLGALFFVVGKSAVHLVKKLKSKI